MKTLTVMATITFIADVYGMNFENMPELEWRYGYLYVILLMAVVTALIAGWFWRKGWIGSKENKVDDEPLFPTQKPPP